jgi:uncharacterized protein YprB with RNaseH-like and TPR domain
MSALRSVACAYCGTVFETTIASKMFCNKQCSDRSRNLPRIPVGYQGEVELKHFNKYPTDVKQRILRGEASTRVVMFDLECTSLKPTVGRILCASFVPLDGEPYTFSALARPYRRPDVFDDSRLAAAIRDELEAYDIIVGWNSKEFDLKFLNARLMRAGKRTKSAQYHLDGMWSWRSKTNAWSKLDTVQKFMLPEGEHKTEIEWEQWMRALGWNRSLREQAMAIIVEHCEHDVLVLREVYMQLVEANVFRSLRLDGGIL